MAKVVLRHVEKRFGHTVVVRDFNLDAADGEFVVLVGPSGCGKTTTLRMIAGLEQASEGEILIGERVVNDVHPKDRDIAMVFQSYALYPHMSVFDNMAFGLKVRGMPKQEIETRVREAAGLLGLSCLLGRKPKELSGGQRQRVAMGRAIVRRPAVFLFDEPLSNLDAKLRGDMRAEISKLHRQLCTTIVYVTHDQVEAMTLADRMVVMKDGVVQQAGTPIEVYEKPANVFVAGFIGSPAMNFLDATARIAGDGNVTVSGEGFSFFAGRCPGLGSGSAVVAGIRPQEFRVTEAGVKAAVEVIEPLGSEAIVWVKIGPASVIVKVQGSPAFREGDSIFLAVPEESIHLFAKETGARLKREVLK